MSYTRVEISRGDMDRQSAVCADIRERGLWDRQPLAFVDTYGCQQNEADSESLRGYFAEMGFGFTADSLPSPERISAAKLLCKEHKTLNFNAIAQGYSCDVIASYLYSIGVKDMLVDIGEIYCDGLNPSGKGWSIGIDNPVDGNDTPGKDLRGVWRSDGSGQGIVTSGNYRKFYVRDGKKYAHTIDPRTGFPVQHCLLSATIVAPSAAEADALATACMVMGPDAAREFVLGHPGIEACLISSDGVWTSEGFRGEK